MVRKQLFNLLFFCLLISVFISGCLKSGGGASSEGPGDPQESGGGGSGGGTDELPIPISGTNILRPLKVKNARVLCSFKSKSRNYTYDSSYRLRCIAATVDDAGNQHIADSIEKGVHLSWKEPEFISGAPILSRRCEISKSKLEENCDVVVQGSAGAPTKILVDLTVTDTSTNEVRTEFAVLFLPFSVESFFFAPQVPAVFSIGVGEGSSLSFINKKFDPLKTYFGDIRSVCQYASRIYFDTGGQIYLLEGGSVRLFAGSGTASLWNDYSHPLRLFFAASSQRLHCAEEGLYVFDGYRIVLLTDTTVTLLYEAPEGMSSSGNPSKAVVRFDIAPLPYGGGVKGTGFAVIEETMPMFGTFKSFLVVDGYGILKIPTGKSSMPSAVGMPLARVTGTITDGGSPHSTLPTAEDLTVGSDGTLYVVEEQGRRVRKVSIYSGPLTTQNSIIQTSLLNVPPANDQLPRGIAANPDGSIYVSDTLGARLLKIDPQGQSTAILSSNSLVKPRGLFKNVGGDLLIADGPLLKKLSADGTLSILAGLSKPDHPINNETVTVSMTETVSGLTISETGITLAEGHHLRFIGDDRIVTTVAGAGSSYSDQIPSQESLLGWTDSIITGHDGTRYFTVGNQIKQISPNGILSTVTGKIDGTTDFTSPNPEGILSFLTSLGPTGVYIRSPYMNPQLQPTPMPIIFGPVFDRFGIPIPPDQMGSRLHFEMILAEKGLAKDATLIQPKGLALATDGTLYVADTFNRRIRKITPDGLIYTILGAGASTAVMPNMSGPSQEEKSFNYNAFLFYPVGLALYDDRTLYFTESNMGMSDMASNGVIRKFDLISGYVSVIAGTRNMGPSEGLPRSKEPVSAVGLSMRPTAIALNPDGKIFFVDALHGVIRFLERGAGTNESNFNVSTFFGTEQQKDCGGGVASGRVTKENIEAAIKSSLGAMCIGYPFALAIKSTCESLEGTITMAFSQTFGSSGNVIKIERACGAADRSANF